jgi:hypothetical protein
LRTLQVAWSDAYRLPLDVLTSAGRKAVDRVRTTCLEELAKDPAQVAVHPSDLLTTRRGRRCWRATVLGTPPRRRRSSSPRAPTTTG